MKYRKKLSRRTFLRGAGTVAIGLPFLDAMLGNSVFAAEPDATSRVLTMFFGLGVPKELQANGFTGPLAPLAPWAGRLSMIRGVDMASCDGDGNNHFDGGGGVFVGWEPQSESLAGGPSIDQVVKQAWYPEGSPTIMDTLSVGSFFRRSRITRYVHCWNNDGSPTEIPLETPDAVFTRLFGSTPNLDASAKEKRYERSVLDSVVDQYQHMTQDRAGLGAASKEKLKDHLDEVREMEQRAFPADPMANQCSSLLNPGAQPLLHGQPEDDGGPTLQVSDWENVWRLNAELYAMALRCDLVRFGNVMFQSAGERIVLQGEYRHGGESIFTFDDQEESHEYWHRYSAGSNNTDHQLMSHHIHFIMAQLAVFLELLDDPNHLDPNGKTIFENSLLMMGTELGDGSRHDLKNVFHAISGANGRFDTSSHHDVSCTCVDLYNTVLGGLGVNETMGNPNFHNGPVSGITI